MCFLAVRSVHTCSSGTSAVSRPAHRLASKWLVTHPIHPIYLSCIVLHDIVGSRAGWPFKHVTLELCRVLWTCAGPFTDVQFMRFVLGVQSVACIPLTVEGSPTLGVLRLGFDTPYSWPAIEQVRACITHAASTPHTETKTNVTGSAGVRCMSVTVLAAKVQLDPLVVIPAAGTCLPVSECARSMCDPGDFGSREARCRARTMLSLPAPCLYRSNPPP